MEYTETMGGIGSQMIIDKRWSAIWKTKNGRQAERDGTPRAARIGYERGKAHESEEAKISGEVSHPSDLEGTGDLWRNLWEVVVVYPLLGKITQMSTVG